MEFSARHANMQRRAFFDPNKSVRSADRPSCGGEEPPENNFCLSVSPPERLPAPFHGSVVPFAFVLVGAGRGVAFAGSIIGRFTQFGLILSKDRGLVHHHL